MQSPSLELKRIIQAGAGAGKTTELVSTFIDFSIQFKRQYQRFPKVVICTFTRKATFELRERLIQKCLELEHLDLLEHLSRKSAVHISTIHGVCTLFLQQQGQGLGFEQPIQIVNEGLTDRYWKKSVRDALKKESSYLSLLDHYKVKELIPLCRLFLTHLNTQSEIHIWKEQDWLDWSMKTLQQLSVEATDLAEGLCAYPLRPPWEEFKLLLKDFPRAPKENSPEEFLSLKKKVLLWRSRISRKPSLTKKDSFDESFTDKLGQWWETVKDFEQDSSLSPELWKKWEEFQTTALSFFQEVCSLYKQRTLQTAQLTFSELEEYSLLLCHSSSKAAESFSEQWDFWMIDEYQDTSPLQEKILQSLIQKKSQFVVGDPQQSIYLFRGADSSLFGKKVEDFQKSQGEFRTKLRNYRSYQSLIHVFNRVFPSMGAPFIEMEPDPAKPLHDETLGTSFRLLPFSLENEEAETELLTSQILELQEKGTPLSEICILARTGEVLKTTSRGLEKRGVGVQLHQQTQFFEQRQVIDAVGFLQFLMNPHQDEILIRLLRSPWLGLRDELIFELVNLLTPKEKTELKSLWSVLKNKNPWDRSRSAHSEWEHSRQRLLYYLSEADQRGLSQTLISFFRKERVWETLNKIDSSGQVEAHLVQLLDILQQFERSGSGPYLELLRRIDEGKSRDVDLGEAAPLASPSRVQLMTIHASKGLQFPHVFLIGLHKKSKDPRKGSLMIHPETRHFSLAFSSGEQERIYAPFANEMIENQKLAESEEQKRVLYVAFTRAQKSLTLIWKKQEKTPPLLNFLNLFEESPGFHKESQFTYQVLQADEILKAPKGKETESTAPLRVSLERRGQVQSPSLSEKKSESAVPLFETLSVTQMAKGTHTVEQNSSEMSLAQIKRLRESSLRGTKLHRILEGLKYRIQESFTLKNKSLDQILGEFKKSLDERDFETVDFVLSLNDIPILSLLEKGHVEWGFQTRYKDQVLKGQIDLWGVHDSKIWIIDYKSGSSRAQDQAGEQLRLYYKALASIYPQFTKYQCRLIALYLKERRWIEFDNSL